MKMFRVYIIFSNPTPKRKKVSSHILVCTLACHVFLSKYSATQFVRDWMLAVGVLIMVIVDLLVLIIFTALAGGLNLPLVEVVPHRENLQTVTGVSKMS